MLAVTMISVRATNLIGWAFTWFATVMCMTVPFAWLFSLRQVALWESPSARISVGLIAGWFSTFLMSEEYAAKLTATDGGGWSFGWLAGSIQWLPTIESSRNGMGANVPLWMIWTLSVVCAGILWRRRRLAIRRWRMHWRERLRPQSRVRIRVRDVILFALIHLAVMGAIAFGVEVYYDEVATTSFGDDPPWVAQLAKSVRWLRTTVRFGAIWPTPIWSILWAWLWIRWRNGLIGWELADTCERCGYDLRGSTTGQCSECGHTNERPRALNLHTGESRPA